MTDSMFLCVSEHGGRYRGGSFHPYGVEEEGKQQIYIIKSVVGILAKAIS